MKEKELFSEVSKLKAKLAKLEQGEFNSKQAKKELNLINDQLKAANQQLEANEQQLREANQQLIAREQELNAIFQQLKANEQQLSASNQQLKANEQQLIDTNKKLAESEKQFRQLFENMEQGFALHQMLYDKSGKPHDYKFILTNRAFERLTGTKDNQFIGKTIREVLPDIDQVWIDNYGGVAKTGETLHFEHFSKEFNRYYNVIAYSPEKDFFAVIFTDDTIRREQNESLHRLNDQLTLGQNIAKLGYWTFDIVTQLPKWSDEVFEMYGIPKEEGEPTYIDHKKFIHKDDWDYFDNSVQNLISKDIPYDIQVRIVCRDKSITWVRSKGYSRINEKGELTVLYGIVQDISDFKLAEKELQLAKEKAEEADRLKSAFLANMSHEIRTPMNGILGFTNLLHDKDLTDNIQQKYIGIIQSSGQRMLSTVNDLIDISKIETGQVEVIYSKINIHNNIENLCNFFNDEISKKGLQLICEDQLSAEEIILSTDEHKFNSILTNLIKNAIKYTDDGIIQIASKRKNNNIQIYVKDTGIGIHKTRQEAIFNRFVQADISDKRAFEGSGLGLAITKAYVEMLGGSIWVESTEGLGSTFYFTLPIIEIKEIINEQNDYMGQAISSPSKKISILIAEDDTISSKHLEILLESISSKIYFATTGTQAVKLFQDNPDINLVLMDIKMPEMSGYEAARKIRDIRKNVPIIAQTAYALEGDRENMLKEGFNDYISKPIDGDLLLQKIKSITVY